MGDIEILLGLYGCAWIAVTLGLYAAGRRLQDDISPPPHPLRVSVLGGALWPLVLIGVVELSSLAVYTKVHAKTSPKVGIPA